MKHVLIPLLCGLLCLSSCELFKLFSPKDELPPETQVGANTFGCLVNGEVWIPKGREGLSSNLTLSYEPNYKWGTLNITAFKWGDVVESITIYSDSLQNSGEFMLDDPQRQAGTYSKSNSCYSITNPSIFHSGKLLITKLDLTQKIVSGRFEFTIAKENCDTLRITQGRFDMKLY